MNRFTEPTGVDREAEIVTRSGAFLTGPTWTTEEALAWLASIQDEEDDELPFCCDLENPEVCEACQ